MSIEVIYTLGSVLLISVLSLVGVFSLSMSEWLLKRCVSFLVAIAIGALLGDAFLHLIPEAFEISENSTTVSLFVLLGIFIFFIIEKYFHWHHGTHGNDEHHKEHCEIPSEGKAQEVRPLGKMILISDSAHNFIDGIVIGVSYLVSIEVGIATTIAVILHEIPQELGDFGVLIHAGYTRARALMLNFMTALFAVLGAVLALVVGSASELALVWILPLAAGSFIYIASSDLTPELHNETSKKDSIFQIVAILLGVLAMYLLLFLE